MKRKIENIKIKELKVLGAYGKMYDNPDLYPHSLRKLSKDVKKNAVSYTHLTLPTILRV